MQSPRTESFLLSLEGRKSLIKNFFPKKHFKLFFCIYCCHIIFNNFQGIKIASTPIRHSSILLASLIQYDQVNSAFELLKRYHTNCELNFLQIIATSSCGIKRILLFLFDKTGSTKLFKFVFLTAF